MSFNIFPTRQCIIIFWFRPQLVHLSTFTMQIRFCFSNMSEDLQISSRQIKILKTFNDNKSVKHWWNYLTISKAVRDHRILLFAYKYFMICTIYCIITRRTYIYCQADHALSLATTMRSVYVDRHNGLRNFWTISIQYWWIAIPITNKAGWRIVNRAIHTEC